MKHRRRIYYSTDQRTEIWDRWKRAPTSLPDPHVRAVLNHTKTSATAGHYARHQYEDEKRKALTKWFEHLSEII